MLQSGNSASYGSGIKIETLICQLIAWANLFLVNPFPLSPFALLSLENTLYFCMGVAEHWRRSCWYFVTVVTEV